MPPGNGHQTSKPAPSTACTAGTTRVTGRTIVSGAGALTRGSTRGFSIVMAGMTASSAAVGRVQPRAGLVEEAGAAVTARGGHRQQVIEEPLADGAELLEL